MITTTKIGLGGSSSDDEEVTFDCDFCQDTLQIPVEERDEEGRYIGQAGFRKCPFHEFEE